MDLPLLSVVVPCYNGKEIIADSLRKLLAFLDAHGERFGPVEVIVVDDGSKDETGALVKDLFPKVLLIRHTKNQGKGAAVREGMLRARGRYRLFIDADLPFDLSGITAIVECLRDGGADVCMGTRSESQIWPAVKRTRLRRLSSAVFSGMIRCLVLRKALDTQCGLKGFGADAANCLFSAARIRGFAFDAEIVYLAAKAGMVMKWTPVRLVSEAYSTVSVFRHGPRMFLDALMIPVRYHLSGYRVLAWRKPESR
jgi:dolichyl-phosphate beta-glucosyltransferase